MSVMLMLRPAARPARMAGKPSTVPGILIMTFGRSTAANKRCASETVRWVSRASAGETSSETKPSWPPLATYTGVNTSQAACTSAIASRSKICGASCPCRANAKISSLYSSPEPIAFSKMEGLDVMPAMPSWSMSRCSPPVAMRLRLM